MKSHFILRKILFKLWCNSSNLSSQEAEAGGSQILGQPGLHRNTVSQKRNNKKVLSWVPAPSSHIPPNRKKKKKILSSHLPEHIWGYNFLKVPSRFLHGFLGSCFQFMFFFSSDLLNKNIINKICHRYLFFTKQNSYAKLRKGKGHFNCTYI
jgi:hypothetical protein